MQLVIIGALFGFFLSYAIRAIEPLQEVGSSDLSRDGRVHRARAALFWGVMLALIAVVVAFEARELIGKYSPFLGGLPEDFIFRQQTWIPVLYFGLMLTGMCAEYMFGLKSTSDFNLREFIKPFWVALIVFAIPWNTVDHQTVSYSSIVACYQNGFFWKKILER